jgi:hypothetical protein
MKIFWNAQAKPMVGGQTPRSNLESTTRLVVEKNVQAVLQSYELSGFESVGFSTKGSVEAHLKSITAVNGDVLGYYKYKLSAWVSDMLDQKVPKRPQGLPESDREGVLLGGRAMKWTEHLKRTDPERLNQLVATVMTVKRAMERPTEEDLESGVRKAFQLLTTKRVREEPDLETLLWSDASPDELEHARSVNEKEQRRQGIMSKAREIVRDVFRGKRFTALNNLEPFFPSTKANYLKTRSKGGAVGYVMGSEEIESLKHKGAKLVSMEAVGKEGGKQESQAQNAKDDTTTTRPSRGSQVQNVMDDTALLDKWRQLYEKLLDTAEKEEKSVKLIGIAEALKVRVISKGPVATYTVLKPLQKWMWRTLKNDPSGVFKLIGEEITAEYLIKQLGTLKEGEKYLSGDYTAATDNLDPEISDAIVDEIRGFIDDRRVGALLGESLTGHLIENPDTGELTKQVWGQLMGAITSFPILCIANAAVCVITREEQLGRKLTLGTAKVAVNGDDCTLRASSAGKIAWEKNADATSMAPNLAKTFWSGEFLNMNSSQYRVREAVPDEEGNPSKFLEWVPRINMGLLRGLGRSTSGKLEAATVASWGTLNSISKNAHTLVEECAPVDKERVFKAYLNANWDLLKFEKGPTGEVKSGTRLPWFLPEELGGIGLPIFWDHEVTSEDGKVTRPWAPTEIDLRLAAAFAKHGKMPSKPPEGVTWKVWEYASRRAREFKTKANVHAMYEFQSSPEPDDRTGGLSSTTSTTMMARLCVEALFTLPFGQVYDERREKNLTLRKIEAEVDKVKRYMGSVEPFQAKSLPNHVHAKMETMLARLTSTAYHMLIPKQIFSG